MRVAFAGTPEFAAAALEAILAAGHAVPLVLSQPDRPAGRGLSLQPGAVKAVALRHGVAVHQPASLKGEAERQPLAQAAPDVLVVAAYGLILPAAVLALPRLGCINIHASLLPRWRGAAPIQRAIEAGDTESGITIMHMDAGLDTGPMLLVRRLVIDPGETGGTLHDRLAILGAQAIVEALARLEAGDLPATPQPAAGVTYARKLEREESALDWRRPARELERRIRAFDPFPGTHARLGDTTLKVWQAKLASGRGEPGEVLAVGTEGITVACAEEALTLTQLQKPGGKRLAAGDFLRGFAVAPGARLDVARDHRAAHGRP
ncbi:MAG: methionyl-tRNA formyltransferase [Betaproteobacteria bacterium]|nr:methionyl-tRNA formyltransferase [Betaproteobacteria bacterium]